MTTPPRILYCHCAYAQVVPQGVKEAVLRHLSESGVAFEAVADLCEMSARRDRSLQRLAAGEGIRIAACFPRAVKWLFAAAQAPLPSDSAEILNMRTQTAEEIIEKLNHPALSPNVPVGEARPPTPAESGTPPAAADAGDSTETHASTPSLA
jgi:hypothetical protein